MSENEKRDITAFLRQRVVPADGSRHGMGTGIEKYQNALPQAAQLISQDKMHMGVLNNVKS